MWLAISAHAWLLLWPAAVMVAVSIAYLVRAPAAFGKRPDGTLPFWAWLAWGPWRAFVYMWIAHEGARRITSEPVGNEVAPGIWVGRRPRPGELPPGVTIVVDLCAEFPRVRRRDRLHVPHDPDAGCHVADSGAARQRGRRRARHRRGRVHPLRVRSRSLGDGRRRRAGPAR